MAMLGAANAVQAASMHLYIRGGIGSRKPEEVPSSTSTRTKVLEWGYMP